MGASRPLVRGTLLDSFTSFDGFALCRLLRQRRHRRLRPRGPEPHPAGAGVLRSGLLRAAIAAGSLDHGHDQRSGAPLPARVFRFGVFDRAAYPSDATLPVKRHGRVRLEGRRKRCCASAQPPGLAAAEPRSLDSVAVIGKSAAEYQRPQRRLERRRQSLLQGRALRASSGRRAGAAHPRALDDGSNRARAARLACGPAWPW